MKTLVTIFLFSYSIQSYCAVIDNFECTTVIKDIEKAESITSLTNLSVPRIKSTHDLSELDADSTTIQNSFTQGKSSFKIESKKFNRWKTDLTTSLYYRHRVVNLDGEYIGQQSVCVRTYIGHCVFSKRAGGYLICSNTGASCPESGWVDVKLNSESGVPSFQDRLLRPKRGNLKGIDGKTLNYEVSCKYKDTIEL